MKKVRYKIEGMHCNSCAMNIDFDLEDLDGVNSSKTSYAKQITEVEFDESRIKLNAITKQIMKTGYKAEIT